MGQYYNILTYKNKKYKIYDRSLDHNDGNKPEYMLAKLTEHSWIYNDTMMSFSNIIYQNPMKIAWVGDYSDDTNAEEITNPTLQLKKVHLFLWV